MMLKKYRPEIKGETNALILILDCPLVLEYFLFLQIKIQLEIWRILLNDWLKNNSIIQIEELNLQIS